jgi:cyclopropane fatty-acyl-phospholipid synthase-like methyltransferase
MVVIKNKESIFSFYKSTIRDHLENQENLFEEVSSDIRQIITKFSKSEYLKALDLGYGYGAYSIFLAESGFKVVAVDSLPVSYLRKRLTNITLQNIMIIRNDLNYFCPSESYDLVIAKDVLHFLSRNRVLYLIERIIKLTKKNGCHYFVIFTDIRRTTYTGELIEIENEANFTSDFLIEAIRYLYKSWKLEIRIEPYRERDSSAHFDRFYFRANRVTIIANYAS